MYYVIGLCHSSLISFISLSMSLADNIEWKKQPPIIDRLVALNALRAQCATETAMNGEIVEEINGIEVMIHHLNNKYTKKCHIFDVYVTIYYNCLLLNYNSYCISPTLQSLFKGYFVRHFKNFKLLPK